MSRKIYLLLIMLCFFVYNIKAQQEIDLKEIPEHPRLLLLGGEEEKIKKMIETDSRFRKIHKIIISESNKMLDTPVLRRELIGKRLLDVSRKALKNIFFLSYSYRITGDYKYAKQAEKELISVCSFIDWNPKHFLDVAEMTMAVAIGYDWLYGILSKEKRAIIEDAILNKGVLPSYNSEYNEFLYSESNWNQVCNSGISLGAMAIAELNRELAEKTIERTINNPLMMKVYEPDGIYCEGPVYWNYGTSFNVILLTMLDKIFNSDFGLSNNPGFMKTPVYLQYMYATDNRYFNYSDCKSKAGLNTTLLYFAQKLKDNSLLWSQVKFLEEEDYSSISGNRLLPAAMVWGINLTKAEITPPSSNLFVGQGHTPLAVMRSSWDNDEALYLGVKLGKPDSSHGHMDIGSFIFSTGKYRWALDFGPQDYESLESKGIDLWNRSQESDRWKVFRYNNMAHNTLTFNNQLQRVDGQGKIERFGESDDKKYVIADLSEVYNGQTEEVKRGYAIIEDRYAVIRDEIKADTATVVRWNMLVSTRIQMKSNNEAVLKFKDGTSLLLRVDKPSDVKIRTWSTQSKNSYDSPNPKTIFIGFEYKVKNEKNEVLQVSMIPLCKTKKREAYFDVELKKW